MNGSRLDRLGLSLIVESGDPRLPALLSEHEPSEILAAAHGASVRQVPASWLQRAQTSPQAEDVLNSAERAGLRWITPGDDEWPLGLSDLDYCEPIGEAVGVPLGLWLRGNGDLTELSQRSVCIVGARSCTTYGADMSRDLAAELSASNIHVISGAAFGIDAFAHRGALAADRPTIAVLAGGVDLAYPRAHAGLLDRIAHDGCLVSEQLPGARPLRRRFLTRNRIIAALGNGTVIVEAAARSGSLNTLNWADQLGRITMAVPGPATSSSSIGAHEAIRDGRAVLVARAGHIAEQLGGLGAEPAAEPARDETVYDQWSSAMRGVYDALDWKRAAGIGPISASAQIPADRTAEKLSILVANGYAGRIGDEWLLLRRADVPTGNIG